MRSTYALAGLLAASSALAETEFSYAHVDEIDGEFSKAFIANWTKPWRKIGPFDVEWEVMFGGIAEREVVRHRGALDRVFFLAGGIRQNYRGFFLSSAVAVIDDQNAFLTTTHQFVSGVGYVHGHFVIALRHISNANTGGENQGENLLSVGYRW